MKFLSQINVNTEYTLPIVDGNNGQVLTTDGNGAVYWGNVSAGVTNLDGLTDVILTSPSSGQLLRYGIPPGSGEANPVWYNFTPNYLTPSSSIDALSDVTISTATTGQILQWSGSQWVNATLSTVEYVSKVQHLVKCGVAVTKGQAVYVTSADGTNMIVGLASNASEATSSKVIGLAVSTGAINDQIFVVTEGLIAGLNTSTATAGDPVWLGTGGNLIFGLANKPVAPAHLVYLGVVTRVQSNNGEIFVNVQNGFELNELHDVLISSPSAGQLIRRDSDGLWKNWTPNYLTSLPVHNHDDRYYTETEITGFFGGELPMAGYNATNWDTAYSWGNHALAGYLTSFTETDPTVPAHVKTITTTEKSNWNTAYGWGNHALAGYATQTWVGLNYYNEGEIDDFFSGAEPISGYNKSNWDTAYNDRITAAAVTGTSTKTLTLTQGDGGTVTATWTDYDTDNDAQVLTWTAPSKELAISNGNSITLDGLATEDYVLSQGFTTFQPWNSGTGSINYTAGKVGINTSSPSEKLHVVGAAIFDGGAGDSSTDSVLYVTKSNSNDWGLYVNASGVDYGMYVRISPSAGYAFGIHNGTTWTTRITGDGRIHLNNKDTIASYDSWLRLNQSGEYTSGVYTPAGLRNDGAFDNYGGIYGYNTIRGRKAQTNNNYTTAALWTESYDNTTTGIAFHISGNVGKFLEMRTDGVLYWENAKVWTAATDGSGSGLDADTVDGIHASTFATRQDGARYSTDVNSLMSSGFYNVEGQPTNSPVSYGQIIVAKGIDTAFQIAGGYSNNALYFRGQGYGPESGGFYPWRRVWHNDDFSSTNISNWNAAYNDRITAVAVSGTGTKTLTLTQQDGGTLTATWTDYDTDNDAQTLSWDQGQTLLSISGGNNITLTGLATEDYVNSQGFVTSVQNLAIQTIGGDSGAFNLDTVSGQHGFVRFSTGSWAGTNPYPGNYSHILSINQSTANGNRFVQMYLGDVPGALFWRMNQGGTIHPWERIWTAGNDGASSGLDADLLDGQHGSYYQPASTAITTSNISSQSVNYASSAGNSDALDGIDSARFIYGQFGNRRGTNLISNWNQTDFPDVAFLSAEAGGANAPTGDYIYGSQYSFHRDGAAYRTQLVTALYSDTSIYVRNSRDSDVWNSWKRLWHSGDFSSTNISNWNTAYGWGNHAGLYLPLSGGTLSGNLNTTAAIAFRDGAGTYSNIIRAAGYPSEGYDSSQTYWMEYRAYGGHHFVLNTDGGVGSGANNMDDFVIWQGAIDGDRLLELTNAGNLTIQGTFTESSSIRFKENIQPLEPALAKVEQLNPVTYTKITSQEEEIGLIAEEVAELFPEVVTYNEEGQPQGIQYQRLSVILLKAVQELTERVNKLENK